MNFLKSIIFAKLISAATEKAPQPVVFYGRVTRVIDGDTIEVQGETNLHRVRFRDIDCPELSQAWGRECADVQSRILLNQPVAVTSPDGWELDKYGRVLGYVTHNSQDVGEKMIAAGMAWAAEDAPPSYQEAMRQARLQQKGLWMEVAHRPSDHRNHAIDPAYRGPAV